MLEAARASATGSMSEWEQALSLAELRCATPCDDLCRRGRERPQSYDVRVRSVSTRGDYASRALLSLALRPPRARTAA